MMKRYIQIFSFALYAALAFAACNVTEFDDPSQEEVPAPEFPYEIRLVPPTKTANDGLSTVWVDGDKVNMFHAEAGTTDYINDGAFTFSTEDRFTGSLKQQLEDGKSYDWYVAYPYDPTMISPKYMRITIPNVQTQLADGDMSHLCEALCPLAGKTTEVAASANPDVMMTHLVGVGQISAPYTVAQAQAIVDGLQAMGFSIFLGVPAYWRNADGSGDAVNDPALTALIKDVDIIMPWLVGACDYDGTVPTTPHGRFSDFFSKRLVDDFYRAEQYSVEYCPLVFPGFSDINMHPDHYVYDRHGGEFYWQQIHRFINQGAQMLYVAMFDEIDEGTAIYKCLRKNEVPSNTYSSDYYVVFENGAYRRSDEYVSVSNGWCSLASELGVTFNGIENDLDSDYYLRLTGQASKILKGEARLTQTKPF